MNSDTEDFHPNWRALATLHIPLKRFVPGKVHEDIRKPDEPRHELQNFNGTEIKEFYEETISQPEKSRHHIKVVHEKVHQKRITQKPQPKVPFDAKKFFQLATSNKVTELRQFEWRDGDINTKDAFGWTALMMAACEGTTETVKLLLELGCDKNVKDKSGKTALNLAIKKGHHDIIKLLQEDQLSVKDQIISTEVDISNPIPMPVKPFYCQTCNCEFKETNCREHQASTVHLFNSQSTMPQNRFQKFNIPSKNRGLQLMVKQGWDQETGLGPTNNGRLYPVKTVIRKQRSGLGIEQDAARVTHFEAFDLRATQWRGQSTFYKKKPRTRNDIRREKIRDWKQERRLRKELS